MNATHGTSGTLDKPQVCKSSSVWVAIASHNRAVKPCYYKRGISYMEFIPHGRK